MTTSRLLHDVMLPFYNFYGPTFVGPDGLTCENMNETEAFFYEYVARYQTYWLQEPTFDSSNVERALPHLRCPPIDFANLTRLLDFAMKDNWGK